MALRRLGLRSASTATSAAAAKIGGYDYVVVGAGTAGCVLANRLSKNPSNSVLLLEAGGTDWYPWIHIPVGYLYTMNNPQTCWCYSTEKQVGLGDRAIAYPRGKVMGGCSSINGMIYQRGQRADYDGWAKTCGSDWSWDSVGPIFDQSKHDPITNPDGEWLTTQQRLSWEVLDTFAEAAGEVGIPLSDQFDNSNDESVGYFVVNQKRGFRLSAYRAFLNDEVRARPNLTIMTGAKCKQVVVNTATKAVEAVEFWVDRSAADAQTKGGGDQQVLRADVLKEVVLAAGSIGSPHILQVSGVGDPSELQQNGVETTHKLEGVGKNLHDHLQIRAVFELKEGVDTLNSRSRTLLGKAAMGLEYALLQSGPMSMAPSQLGCFAKSSPEMETPNIQYHVQPLSLDKFGDPLHYFPGLTTSVCNLRPTSRGAVTLQGPDARTAPKIDPNYLATEEDRAVASASLRHARNIMATDAFAAYEPVEYFPGSELQSDAELADAAGRIATSIFHPVGTCKMGPASDKTAVVNPKLQVHGIKGLRVADASIMPQITSGNTNSPTIMIAENAASMMLKDNIAV